MGRLNLVLALILAGCHNQSSFNQLQVSNQEAIKASPDYRDLIPIFEEDSWQNFLRNLPIVDSPVLDYKGRLVDDQHKHAGIIPFDVGTRDLQQCADALMRLRAEYLFGKKLYEKIGFHFTGGQFYSFTDYCNGKRPLARGNDVVFINNATTVTCSRQSLRKYLDIVYTYAGTISLAKELKPATDFEVGTVVIHAGSPGHCFIIIDESRNEKGERVFKLAEGYTPAQSIYLLRNTMVKSQNNGERGDPWHRLDKGMIQTASYTFRTYKLGKFE